MKFSLVKNVTVGIFITAASAPLLYTNLDAQQGAFGIPSMPGAMPGGMQGMPGMPPMDEEALNKMFMEMLSQMSDEEIEELAKIGEQIMQDLEKQGIELPQFGPQAPLLPPTKTPEPLPQPVPSIEPSKLPEVPPVKPPVSTRTIEAIRKTLETIIERTASLRQKGASDKKVALTLEPWGYHFDDLVFYAHYLSNEKRISYLRQKDFDKLYQLLERLAKGLIAFEPQFIVPEYDTHTQNPFSILGVSPTSSYFDSVNAYNEKTQTSHPDVTYKKLQEQKASKEDIDTAMKLAWDEFNKINEAFEKVQGYYNSGQALDSLLREFGEIIHKEKLFDEIKKLQAIYDPEALKTRLELEKSEQEARKAQEEAQRRQPPFTFAFPAFDLNQPSYAPSRPFEPSLGGGGTPPIFGGEQKAPFAPAVNLDSKGRESTQGAPGTAPAGGAEKKEAADKKTKAAAPSNTDVEGIITEVTRKITPLTNYINGDRVIRDDETTQTLTSLFTNLRQELEGLTPEPNEATSTKVTAINTVLEEISKQLESITKAFNDKVSGLATTISADQKKNIVKTAKARLKNIWQKELGVYETKLPGLFKIPYEVTAEGKLILGPRQANGSRLPYNITDSALLAFRGQAGLIEEYGLEDAEALEKIKGNNKAMAAINNPAKDPLGTFYKNLNKVALFFQDEKPVTKSGSTKRK